MKTVRELSLAAPCNVLGIFVKESAHRITYRLRDGREAFARKSCPSIRVPDTRSDVPADGVYDRITDPGTPADWFKQMPPAVIWGDLSVVNAKLTNPLGKPLTHLGGWRLLALQWVIFSSGGARWARLIEQRAIPVRLNEPQKPLRD